LRQSATIKKAEPVSRLLPRGCGTALALQIGHRVSVDFDLFSDKDIEPSRCMLGNPPIWGNIRREAAHSSFMASDPFSIRNEVHGVTGLQHASEEAIVEGRFGSYSKSCMFVQDILATVPEDWDHNKEIEICHRLETAVYLKFGQL
jgi:hypothetical protein